MHCGLGVWKQVFVVPNIEWRDAFERNCSVIAWGENVYVRITRYISCPGMCLYVFIHFSD